MRSILSSVAAILICAVIEVHAQTHQSVGSEAPNGSEDVKVPLIDDGVLIKIPVKIFNRILNFSIDTGSGISVLDSKYRDQLGPPLENVEHDTVILSKNITTLYSAPKFSVGAAAAELEHIACMDFSMLKKVSGGDVDGMLGMDFLCQYALSIDFDNKSVLLSRVLSREVKERAIRIPLVKVKKRHFGVESILNDKAPVILMLDTGDNGAVSLNTKDWDAAFGETNKMLMQKVFTSSIGNQVSESLLARLPTFRVGETVYRNNLCSKTINPNTPSTLGVLFLRQHIVSLDFPSSAMYLKAGQHFMERQNPDMSGLHLLDDNTSLLVYAVDKGSSADEVGIRSGDHIVAIDGEQTSRFPIKVARDKLRSGNGNKVTIGLMRGSRSVNVTVELKTSL